MNSATLKFIHWIMAIIVLAMIGSGLIMIDMDDTNTAKWFLYTQHESVGVLLFCFLFVRLFVRFFTKYSAGYKMLPGYQMVIVRIIHSLLYLAMFGLCISGYFQAAPYGVFLFEIPIPVIQGEFYAAGIGFYIHTIVGKIIIFLIAIHVLGSFFHRYISESKGWGESPT